MKILSVYQAHTKNAEGKLPECDYISEGCASGDIALFEAARDLLAACKRALQQTDSIARPADYKMIADAIAKAEGPWSNKAEAWRSKDWPFGDNGE